MRFVTRFYIKPGQTVIVRPQAGATTPRAADVWDDFQHELDRVLAASGAISADALEYVTETEPDDKISWDHRIQGGRFP